MLKNLFGTGTMSFGSRLFQELFHVSFPTRWTYVLIEYPFKSTLRHLPPRSFRSRLFSFTFSALSSRQITNNVACNKNNSVIKAKAINNSLSLSSDSNRSPGLLFSWHYEITTTIITALLASPVLDNSLIARKSRPTRQFCRQG